MNYYKKKKKTMTHRSVEVAWARARPPLIRPPHSTYPHRHAFTSPSQFDKHREECKQLLPSVNLDTVSARMADRLLMDGGIS